MIISPPALNWRLFTILAIGQLALLILDTTNDAGASLLSYLLLPVLLAAAIGTWGQVASLGIITVVAGVAAGVMPNPAEGLGIDNHPVRLAAAISVSLLAVWVAYARQTAQKRADLERTRLGATLDSLLDPHIILKPMRGKSGRISDFTFLDANKSACDYLKTTKDRLIGHRLLDIIPGNKEEGLFDLYTSAFEKNKPLSLDNYRFNYLPQVEGERFFDIRAIRAGDVMSLAWRDVTDRRQALRKLASSEALYRLLADNSSDVIMQLSPEGIIEFVTPSVRVATGWLPEETIGKPMLALIHPEDRPQLEALQLNLAAGLSGKSEFRARLSTGEYRWFSTSSRPTLDAHGAIIGSVSSWRDIHQEMQQRQAAAQEHAKLAATMDSLIDPHVLIEAMRDTRGEIVDFVFLEANHAACADNKKNREEMIGHRMLEFFPSLAHTAVFSLWTKALETGQPVVLNDYTLDNDVHGEQRRYDIRAVRVGNSLSLTWRDVTERFEASQNLARSEEHYRLLAENSSDVVVRTDDKFRITWASPSLISTLGWDPLEWIGRKASQLGPRTEDGRRNYRSYKRAISGERVVLARDQVYAKDGSTHWVEIHAGPYLNARNQRDGIVASFRVVDAEVAAEKILEHRARTDQLTELLNRREVLEQITLLNGHVQRTGKELAVIFCDLDFFKSVNDTHGHTVGDEVLRNVAQRIRSSLRSSDDLAARMGGDELLVVLRGVQDMRNAMDLAEDLRKTLAEPIMTKGGSVSISASIGVALARPGETTDELVSRADEAMYRAKLRGRNQVISIETRDDGGGSDPNSPAMPHLQLAANRARR